MKILPFNPPAPGTVGRTERRQNGDRAISDFSSYLDQAKSKAAVDKISIENRLASQGNVEDVGMAGSLLNTLVGQISACQPRTLKGLHNLDGILCYWQL